MKKLFTLFLITKFLFQACTSEDKHPNVLPLEKLIENGEVVFIEKKDSVSLLPSITFLNDSVYFTQSQHHTYSGIPGVSADQKMAADVVITNSFQLKNIFSGKTYLSDTIGSKSQVFINEKNDIAINDIAFLAPDYASKTKADTSFRKKISDIKTDEKLKQLNEFDQSVITKWTNTGRLGTMHEIFYYELNGKEFKSSSPCYLIAENGNYFYNDKLGILQMK